jgi:hypothetical protein
LSTPLIIKKVIIMLVTTKELLDGLERGKLDVLKTATPEEVDDAFEALDGLFSFNRFTGGLKVNPAVELAPNHRATAERLVTAFKERVHSGIIVLKRAPSGTFVPVTQEGETERGGLSSNPCHWHWWLKVRWWGFRLSLNSCAVNIIAGATGGIAAVMSSLGLPALVGIVLGIVAALIKAFDNGIGVRIYFTWFGGVWWITAKPA